MLDICDMVLLKSIQEVTGNQEPNFICKDPF